MFIQKTAVEASQRSHKPRIDMDFQPSDPFTLLVILCSVASPWYPIDNSSKPNFARDQTIDLVALKLLYDDIMILLCHTADVFGENVEIQNFLRRDFSRDWN